MVRREGTAPDGVEEVTGDFTDPDFAASVVAGADAVVTTVYPMGSGERSEQAAVSVEGTTTLARAAATAGVARLVHLSTAGVYDRSPGAPDVDEAAALVADDGGDYATVKRDTDAALADVDGITRVLLRPPAILGSGETSVWNTVIPAEVRDDESERHAVAEKSLPWVHVDDLAAFAAAVAVGAVAASDDPETGPVEGGCTPVNVASGRRDLARLPRCGLRGGRRRPRVGRRPGLDRSRRRRPRRPLGLLPHRHLRRRARRARRRAAGLTSRPVR